MENKNTKAILEELIDITSGLLLEEQTIILSVAKGMKFSRETMNNNKVNFKDSTSEKIKDMPKDKLEKVLELMDKIFNQLSEVNQDIIILLAKSMKISKEVNKQHTKHQSIWKQK